MKHLVAWIIAVLALLSITGMLYLNRVPEPSTTVDGRMAPEVIKEDTKPLIIGPIQVYEPAVKTKLKLTRDVIKDTNKHVVAATKVRADEHPRTITTVVDQTTGQFTSYERVDPLPWLAVNSRTHIGAYYGLKNLEPVLRIQVQQEIVQVKALHIEAIASVDIGAGKPDPFIGIGGRFSF